MIKVKAIYTKINNKVYKINQVVDNPQSIVSFTPGVSSNLSVDNYNKQVTQNININTLKKPGTQSNAQMYNDLVEFLNEREITEINTLQNLFKVYIEYSMYQDGVEVERASVIKPVRVKDKAIILGTGTNNECVYRHVKYLNPTVDFKLRSVVPHGVMRTPVSNYILKIHNVSILQSTIEYYEIHNSTYDVAYGVDSKTMAANLDGWIVKYSTANAGFELQEVQMNFIPHNISVYLDIILTDYVVAYDENNINKIITENIEKKYANNNEDDDPPSTPDDSPSGTDIIIPDEDDTHEEADGDYDPDENGYFSWYERCKSTTPDALLVVEDLIPDSTYDSSNMIKKSMVIKDINDIEVGDYVVYRQSIITN